MNAGNRLERELAGWATVERAGVHVTPRSASITLTPSDDVADEELASLVAKASVEAAYAMPWIGSLEFQLSGRAITIEWDSVAKYVARDLTLVEFHDTWTINGESLPAPAGH